MSALGGMPPAMDELRRQVVRRRQNLARDGLVGRVGEGEFEVGKLLGEGCAIFQGRRQGQAAGLSSCRDAGRRLRCRPARPSPAGRLRSRHDRTGLDKRRSCFGPQHRQLDADTPARPAGRVQAARSGCRITHGQRRGGGVWFGKGFAPTRVGRIDGRSSGAAGSRWSRDCAVREVLVRRFRRQDFDRLVSGSSGDSGSRWIQAASGVSRFHGYASVGADRTRSRVGAGDAAISSPVTVRLRGWLRRGSGGNAFTG
jgi:hypothetical protein